MTSLRQELVSSLCICPCVAGSTIHETYRLTVVFAKLFQYSWLFSTNSLAARRIWWRAVSAGASPSSWSSILSRTFCSATSFLGWKWPWTIPPWWSHFRPLLRRSCARGHAALADCRIVCWTPASDRAVANNMVKKHWYYGLLKSSNI